jgi:hypothetical protein
LLSFYSGDYKYGANNLNSIFVPEDSAFKFLDILHKANAGFDYYHRDNVDFRKYKKQIIEMFTELIQWLSNIREDKITIVGV